MSKREILGFGVLGVGIVIGFLIGDWTGLAWAAVCLILGLVLVVAAEARGLVSKPAGAKASSGDRKQARLLVLLREVDALPQRDGKFQEIRDPSQTDLEFEVFVNCWLLNETDISLRIADLQFTLKGTDGSSRGGERISDLKNWSRKIERVSEEEESDGAEARVRTAPASLVELDTVHPLECGAPREGWLHFRIRHTTPAEFRTGSLELSLKDSLSHTHTAAAGKARHLPGKIEPISAGSRSETSGESGSSAA